MKIKPAINSALWMIPGAVLLVLIFFVAGHFRQDNSSATQLAFKARRVDLVSRMELGLASASEAEKSAVMAITDAESITFADQARAATVEVERKRVEAEELLKTGGAPGERDLLVRFSQAFVEFQRTDKELLRLAVLNTNLKASGLAFGPAARAVDEMNAALSRLVADHAESADAKNLMTHGLGAQIAVLRVLALLPPHIAEESDQKMDELEVSMAKLDERVQADLSALAALPSLRGNADLATATSSYARFKDVRVQILKLSRENTNVRSLTMSLTEKRCDVPFTAQQVEAVYPA